MLKKVRKGISGLLLAGVLFLNAGTTAMAADAAPKPEIPNLNESLEVVKKFEMAEGLKTPEERFSFKIVSDTKNPKNTPSLTVASVTYGAEDIANVIDGKRTISKKAAVTLPKANQFPHAGEYLYTLTEQKPTQNANQNITYSNESYTLRVRVKNASTGNGLEIASVTANKTTDGDTNNDENKVGEISFTNTYAKNSILTIEKQTTGEFADKTKRFEFAITFTKKSDNDTKVYTGKIGNEQVECMAGKKVIFHLKHGDKLIFDDVPVGTRYVVEEEAATDGYTPSVTVTENGGSPSTKAETNEANGISSKPNDASDSLVGECENKVVFENAYQDIAITGVVMNNLPFILLVIVAVTALGILVFLKKKISGKQ